MIDHAGGRAYEINLGQDLGRAFWVSQHFDVRKLPFVLANIFGGKSFMNLTVAFPKNDFDLSLIRDIAAKKFIGQKNHAIDV